MKKQMNRIKIPQTGESLVYVLLGIIFLILSIIGYRRFKKYKNIKIYINYE